MEARTKKYSRCALFAAIIALCSQLTVPLPPIPFNMALFGVWLCAALFGGRLAALCTALYLSVGALGLPVFSGLQGGLQVLAGPTGGFLISYPVCAAVCGALINRARSLFPIYPASMLIGCIICYGSGCAWYSFSTSTPFAAALTACVVPFIIPDMLKIALASTIAYRLNKADILK